MFRIVNYFCIIALVFFMVGCSSETPKEKEAPKQQEEQSTKPPTEQPHIEGVITKLDNGTILVEEEPEKPDVSEKAEIRLNQQTKYWIQTGEQHKRGKQADLQKGMKVKVWYTGIVMDSYPVQTTGGHIVYAKQ